MTESGFKIGIDPEPSDALARDPLYDHTQIQRLKRRITLISIVLPLVVGIVLLLAYMDVKRRVTRTHDLGAAGVESISQDLESRYSNLSVRQAALEEALQRQIKAAEQASKALKPALAAIETELEQLKVHTQSSEKEIRKALADKAATQALDKQLKTIRQATAKNSAGLKTAATQFTTDLEALRRDTELDMDVFSENLNKSSSALDQLASKVATLGKSMVDQTDLKKALKGREKFSRETLNQITKSLNAHSKSLEEHQKNIDLTQNKIIEMQRTLRFLSLKLSTAAPATNPSTASDGTDFSEQNVQD